MTVRRSDPSIAERWAAWGITLGCCLGAAACGNAADATETDPSVTGGSATGGNPAGGAGGTTGTGGTPLGGGGNATGGTTGGTPPLGGAAGSGGSMPNSGGAPPPGGRGGSGGAIPSGGAGGAAAGAPGGGAPGSGGGAATSGQGGGGAAGSGGAPAGGSTTGGDGGSTGAAGGAPGGGAGDDRCDVGVWDGSTPVPLTLSGNTFAHDPTMIEANGVYYRFWTGDYIPSATSTNLTNWSNAPTVFRGGYSPWVSDWLAGIPGQTFNFPWAPDISYFGGQYHLYSTFSAIFGDNISCITHLTTSDLAAGSFTDQGPVVCTDGSERYNAIDADAGTDLEGNPYLAFGSFWDGIQLIPLTPDGSRLGTELTRLAWAPEIEAPVLFRRCGYYYLFVSWGVCCPGNGRSVNDLTYRVVVGRSTSIAGPYVDRDGVAMVDGGGTLVVEGDHVNWAAAGHSDVLVTGDRIYHLYHAYRQSDGGAQLRIVEMPFDEEGWPVPGGP